MSVVDLGRYDGTSPATAFVALSAATASSPAFLVTATSAGTAQTVHTADAKAQDVVNLVAWNNSGGSATIYAQLGSTASTNSLSLTLSANTFGTLVPGIPISNLGVVGVWCGTATNVIVVAGSVQRTFI